jgi:rhodanese-related sulfurtransferase
MKYAMQLISRDELKRKLERKDQFKLVMALGDWQYRAKHIPGSLHFPTPEEALASLA